MVSEAGRYQPLQVAVAGAVVPLGVVLDAKDGLVPVGVGDELLVEVLQIQWQVHYLQHKL